MSEILKEIYVTPGRSMDLDKYLSLMNEIKLRISIVNDFIVGKSTTGNLTANAEFMCLQLRKILELIAMGSIVANKEDFEAIREEFRKCWNAKLILQDIEGLNPVFYPMPVKENVDLRDSLKSSIEDHTTEYLTREKFVKVYDKCGKFMHSYNPYGSQHDVNYYIKNIPDWIKLIKGLLNTHIIKLAGATNFYLIHMEEDGDNLAHGYDFEMISSKKCINNEKTDMTSKRLIIREFTDSNGITRTKYFKADE